MASAPAYLDHNASSPLLPEARDAIRAVLELSGNPSSVHAAGRALRTRIDAARAEVAGAAGARCEEVVFTGSATEAIAQAILGGARAFGVSRVVTTAGEHASVLRAAEATGLPVVIARLDADGAIVLDDIAAALPGAGEGPALVAVHAVNGETGVVQPIERIGALVGPTPHLLFVDAAQSFGKLPLEFSSSAPDMMAISAHKIGGPAGVGALLMKGHANEVRLIPGGGQEQGRRGGTESAALIAGFGAAASVFAERYRASGVSALARRLEAGILDLCPEAVVFGADAPRLGNVVNFAVPGISSAIALMRLDLEGIAVSSGSACSSGKVAVSAVLLAMGVESALAGCAVRVSLGWSSVEGDVDAFLAAFARLVAQRRGRAA